MEMIMRQNHWTNQEFSSGLASQGSIFQDRSIELPKSVVFLYFDTLWSYTISGNKIDLN